MPSAEINTVLWLTFPIPTTATPDGALAEATRPRPNRKSTRAPTATSAVVGAAPNLRGLITDLSALAVMLMRLHPAVPGRAEEKMPYYKAWSDLRQSSRATGGESAVLKRASAGLALNDLVGPDTPKSLTIRATLLKYLGVIAVKNVGYTELNAKESLRTAFPLDGRRDDMLSPEHLIDFEILSAAEPNGSGPAFDLRGTGSGGNRFQSPLDHFVRAPLDRQQHFLQLPVPRRVEVASRPRLFRIVVK